MTVFPLRETLLKRALGEGGFAGRPGGGFRPDATAWAILGLNGTANGRDAIERARSLLAGVQKDDGRICISPDHPEAYWPTPLAILAWHGEPRYRERQSRAVGFLLMAGGRHWRKESNSPFGHDTSLQGWPWVEDTHSWVEPTALSLMALRVAGHQDHERVREAMRMLMDRQLPRGGWNYGNTSVYGKIIDPIPDSTGIALNAIAGLVSRSLVQRSLEYLRDRSRMIRTPYSLAWSLLGLGAWNEQVSQRRARALESVRRARKYGDVDTTTLSLTIIALRCRGGIFDLFAPGQRPGA